MDRTEKKDLSGEHAARLTECLDALRSRRDDVRRALDGRGLAVRIRVDSAGLDRHLLFVPSGDVVDVRPGGLDSVHVEIRGSEGDVEGFLAGFIPLRVAVQRGVVVLHVDEAQTLHYTALRRVIAQFHNDHDPAG